MGRTLKAALISIVVNIGLLASKIIVATLTNSIGLYAEAAHSGFDLLSSLLAYIGIKKTEEPSDENHHFGHEKFENLSSLFQALLIFGTATVVIYESYQKLSEPFAIENSELGIILILFSLPITYFTSKYLSKTAHSEGGNHALEADSAHFLTDSVSSIAILIGLIFVKLGFPIFDIIAAFAVGIIMIGISGQFIIDAFHIFTDISPNKKIMKKIEMVLISEKRITRYHKLRARLAGSKIFVDVHIHFPHKTDIVKAHKIAHEIENEIIKQVPKVKEVSIHMEPD